jgi:hypothetical protein
MVEGIDISALPSTSYAFCDLHKSMINFIFFFSFTMGKAYEWKALQECNASYRLILKTLIWGMHLPWGFTKNITKIPHSKTKLKIIP